jgi:hypothetical protein
MTSVIVPLYNLVMFNVCTDIPISRPLGQVGVVYSSVSSDMLARPYQHVLRGCDVAYWAFVRICVRDPHGDWEAIGLAPELDGDCAAQEEK